MSFDGWQYLKRPALHPSPQPKVHHRCEKELQDLFRDVKQQAVLKTQLKKRLDYLLANPEIFHLRTEWYESIDRLSDGRMYFSMRFNYLLGNLRILFVMEDRQPCLAVAFLEHNKRDYEKAKQNLNNRMKGK